VSAPEGTTISDFRHGSGSFGTSDGVVDGTLLDREWQDKAVRAMWSPQAVASMHDPASNNFGQRATLNRNGEPNFAFDRPVGYRFPLEVGQAWTSKHQMTVYPDRGARPSAMNDKAEAQESLTVRAGTFKTYRVLITDRFGQVDRYWISPETGIVSLKRTQSRPASHPQGAGQLDGALTSLKVATQRSGEARHDLRGHGDDASAAISCRPCRASNPSARSCANGVNGAASASSTWPAMRTSRPGT
jgi:hypothetical protein